MAVHIHDAAAGAAGPIVVTLSPFDVGGPFSDGCIGGLDPTLVADIAANPDDYYVNVHTDDHPDGAVRGQLDRSTLLGADLTGASEIPGPGDPDGSGEVFLDLVGDGLVCLRLTVRGIGTPMAAHIHDAAVGAAGPIVVTLPTPIFNTSSGCVEVAPALFADIAAHPGEFYVNVHNEQFPAGAVRGQLAPRAVPLRAGCRSDGVSGVASDTPSDLTREQPAMTTTEPRSAAAERPSAGSCPPSSASTTTWSSRRTCGRPGCPSGSATAGPRSSAAGSAT